MIDPIVIKYKLILYTKNTLIGIFHAQRLLEEYLKSWVKKTWEKYLGYIAKTHMGSIGYITFIFDSQDDQMKVAMQEPWFGVIRL